MKLLRGLLCVIGISLLFNCSNQADKQEPETTEEVQKVEKAVESCIYSFDRSTARIYWTAFKHSNRVAVNGQIDSVRVMGIEDATNIQDLIRNASINIYPASVNSKDQGRDQKIRTFFFGSMQNTNVITGNTKSLSGNSTSGTGTCALMLNGVTKEVDITYSIENETIQIRCSLDFNDFNCEESLSKLQNACAEKHTGIDGKTIFWADAEILVEVDVVKQCD